MPSPHGLREDGAQALVQVVAHSPDQVDHRVGRSRSFDCRTTRTVTVRNECIVLRARHGAGCGGDMRCGGGGRMDAAPGKRREERPDAIPGALNFLKKPISWRA